jgi:ferrous iron transport protein A
MLEENNTNNTLLGFKAQDRGRVTGFAPGERGYRQKLLAMGLTPGTEFQIVRIAPLGDPIEMQVRGFSLSLRRLEAKSLYVEKLDP